jgi:AcrR family transcriptional regulator
MMQAVAKSGMRMTAEERRADVLVAAATAFAEKGFAGTSTEEIARLAGISQPYLFRLYKTKKDLFLAAATYGFEQVLETFERAADGLEGEDALLAMGAAYIDHVTNGTLLLLQLQSYAAAGDIEIRAAVGARFSELIAWVRDRTGVDFETLQRFFATGMLLNVVAALGLDDFGELCSPIAARP